MDIINNVVNYISGLGAYIVMPIFLIIIGLVFKMPFTKAVKSGLLVGIGFYGINLVLGLMGDTVTPACTALGTNAGIDKGILDVGFGAVGTAAYATPIAALIIPVAIIVNVIMIATGLTKTLNIDIWNMFHFILAGGITYLYSQNIVISVIVAAIFVIFVLKMADWFAPSWQKTFGLEGTTMTCLPIMTNVITSYYINKLIDLIPGLRDIDISQEKAGKLGMLLDPAILGAIIGLILGAVAGLDVAGILTTGIGVAASMVLAPKMVSVMMEGLAPISKAAQKSVSEKYADRELLIGLDPACGCGDSTVMAVTAIMIPIYLLLAIILPGNKYLPIVSLPSIIYFAVAPVANSKGNYLRSIICMILWSIAHLYVLTALSPIITQFNVWAGIALPEGATLIAGGNPEHIGLLLIKPILSIFGLVK